MLTESWEKFRYHEIQKELWNTEKRFAAVVAGRGSGKTELARRRLVLWLAVKKPWNDPRYFYGAPTEKQAKRIAWRRLINLIPKHWIAKDGIKLGDLTIETIFGSMIQLIGLDAPQRIEGVQWDGGVLDESSDIRPGVFDLNVFPALTHRNGWCWRIGVPKRQGIGAAEFKEFSERVDEDIISVAWSSSDILPPEALEYARKNLDPKDYREQFEASWETAGGGVFHAFDSNYNVRPVTYFDDRAIIVSCDFNVDPMCWVIGHRYKEYLEFFDELFIRNTNTQRSLDALYSRYSRHMGGFEFYGDATGRSRKTSADETDYAIIAGDKRFQQLGRTVHFAKGNPRVLARFAACNRLLCNAEQERNCFIDPRVKHLITDLQTRSYKIGGREANDFGDVGHMTDAFGYVAHRLFPVRLLLDMSQAKVMIR